MWQILNIPNHLTAGRVTVHLIPNYCYTNLETSLYYSTYILLLLSAKIQLKLMA